MDKIFKCGCTANGGPVQRITTKPKPIGSAQSAAAAASAPPVAKPITNASAGGVFKAVAMRADVTEAERIMLKGLFFGDPNLDPNLITVERNEAGQFKLVCGKTFIVIAKGSNDEGIIRGVVA